MDTARSSRASVNGSRGLQFHLLGRLEAYRDGVELDLGPRKQRAVLALLLLNANRVVSTERLIDDLWGDSPPHTARSALQVYIAGLRKALTNDGATLRTRAPGYVLELEPGALDVDRFAQLRAQALDSPDLERRAALLHEALTLWRDAPLAELRTEQFSTAAVAQLEELRLGTLEERIDADLSLGRHAALAPELDVLVAEHPYREGLRGQLMLALYRSGRQAEALEAYQAGRRALRDDLGLEPGTELRDLEAAILRHDEALLPGRRRPNEPAAGPQIAGLAPVSRSRRRTALLVVAPVAILTAITAAFLARGEPAAIAVPPNSVAVIDTETNRVLTTVPVGIRPGPVAVGAGSVWVGNLEDKTLTRIDPTTRQVVRTITLGATPTGVAVGAGAVWVAHGLSGRLSRIETQFYGTRSIEVTGKPIYFSTAGVAVGADSVWAVFGDSTLARVDPAAVRESGSTLAGQGPVGIAAENGSVWVSNSGDSTVQRFEPKTFEQGPLQTRGVGETPSGIAVGEGAVWVASTGDDIVTRIDPGSKSEFQIPVGDGPTGVAVGGGAVWVANTAGGTVSRIDPSAKEVTRTIELDVAPSGIAVANGLVWVAAQAP